MRKIIKKIISRIQLWLNPPISDIEILRKHGVKVGENVHVYGHDFDLRYGKLLEIGSNVSISHSTILMHDAGPSKYVEGDYGTKLKKVVIGDNVFIGYGCLVLPGTKINDNVIIGAGTVVRGEIPSDSVICGNPWQRVCSATEYIERNRKCLESAAKYDGDDFAEVAKLLDDGKDVFIKKREL